MTLFTDPYGCRKERSEADPYAVFRLDSHGWEWRVLKAWQKDSCASAARWMVAAKSPATYGGYDYGDRLALRPAERGATVHARAVQGVVVQQ